MGTWDVGIWDNDDAADWVGDLSDADDLDLLRNSLQPVEVKNYYLEAPDGVRILCVADTLRAALNLGESTAPEDVLECVKKHSGLDFRSLVPEAVARPAAYFRNTANCASSGRRMKSYFRPGLHKLKPWLSRLAANQRLERP